jgi:spore maturation protein B
MNSVVVISNMIIPFIVILVIVYGYLNKVEVYDVFVEGAKEGVSVVINILPTLIGLMIAVGMLRASGALDILSEALRPIANIIGFPAEAIPLTLMKPISSSAATGLFLDLLKKYGADAFVTRFAAVMLGSTETIFYTISVYFMSVNIKKTRYTLVGGLLATFAGVVASLIMTRLFF